MPTCRALPEQPRLQRRGALRSAGRAPESFRPPRCEELLAACSVARDASLEVDDGLGGVGTRHDEILGANGISRIRCLAHGRHLQVHKTVTLAHRATASIPPGARGWAWTTALWSVHRHHSRNGMM